MLGRNEMKDHIERRRIYVNYPEENITDFMDKFLSDDIIFIVGILNSDENIIYKTQGYEIGTKVIV